MKRWDFIAYIQTIMHEEGWQAYKGRHTKTSISRQRQAINAIAKVVGIKKLTLEEVEKLGWG